MWSVCWAAVDDVKLRRCEEFTSSQYKFNIICGETKIGKEIQRTEQAFYSYKTGANGARDRAHIDISLKSQDITSPN